MKWVVAVAVLVLLGLQYSLWFGQSGYFARERLGHELDVQQARVALLRERNQILVAEVHALKDDDTALEVLEARARRDLGLVKPGEVFYLIPEKSL